MKKLNNLLADSLELDEKYHGNYYIRNLCSTQDRYNSQINEKYNFAFELKKFKAIPTHHWGSDIEPVEPNIDYNLVHVCNESCTLSKSAGYRNIPLTDVDMAKEIARITRNNLHFNSKLNDKKGGWEFMDDEGLWIEINGESPVHNVIQNYVIQWNRLFRYIFEEHDKGLQLYRQAKRKAEQKVKELQNSIRKIELQIKGMDAVPEDLSDELAGFYREQSHWENEAERYGDTIEDEKKNINLNEFERKYERFNSESGIRAIHNVLKAFLPVIIEESDIHINDDSDYMNEPQETLLVDDLIPRIGLGQIYGESGIGKSFASVSLALSVATGQPSWAGKNLNVNGPTEVLYIAAEGGQSWSRMVRSWKVAHGMDPETQIPTFKYFDFERAGEKGSRLEITKSGMAEEVGTVGIKELRQHIKTSMNFNPKLIIIDPQADVTGSVDENGKALSDALRQAKRWGVEEEALVLLVHHTGKDASLGARGSSSQKAMMNVQMWFKDGEGEKRSIEFTKVKGKRLPKEEFEFEFHDLPGDMTHLKYIGLVESSRERELAIKEGWKFRIVQVLNTEGGDPMSSSKLATLLNPQEKDFRKKVQSYLEELESEGKAFNRGNKHSPKWFKSYND